MQLFLFIGVAEDDDLTVARRPKDITVEVIKKLFGKLLISWGVRAKTFLIRRWRKIYDWSLPGGTSLLKYWWARVVWGDLR
jgi:hypothetical protein